MATIHLGTPLSYVRVPPLFWLMLLVSRVFRQSLGDRDKEPSVEKASSRPSFTRTASL